MYDMLERLLSQTAPIHATFAESDIRRDRSVLLTTDEQSSAEELLIVLKELKTATTIVCDQKTPSISMILPVLMKLKKRVRDYDSDFIWDFGKLPFPTHLGKYFIKIGKIRAKIHEIGKIKAIFGLGMTPIYGLKNGQIKSLYEEIDSHSVSPIVILTW